MFQVNVRSSAITPKWKFLPHLSMCIQSYLWRKSGSTISIKLSHSIKLSSIDAYKFKNYNTPCGTFHNLNQILKCTRVIFSSKWPSIFIVSNYTSSNKVSFQIWDQTINIKRNCFQPEAFIIDTSLGPESDELTIEGFRALFFGSSTSFPTTFCLESYLLIVFPSLHLLYSTTFTCK